MNYPYYSLLRLLIVPLLAGGAFCVSAQNASLQSANSPLQTYTATGSMLVVGSLGPELTLTNVYGFTLYRTRDNWKIRMKTEESSYTGGLTLSEYGLVSPTNSYQLNAYEPSDKESVNDYSLYLYSQKNPNGHVVPIWLAFIGGSYLDRSGKGDIKTPFPPETKLYEQHLTLPAEWKFHSPDAPYPMVASYVDYPAESKETKNQTNACYEVLSWTNALGQSFPQIAKASQYFGSLEDSSFTQFELTVESIQPGVPENIFQFAPPEKTMVYDKRILLEDNIPVLYDYFSKTGGIQSIDAVVSDPRFNDLAANARMEAKAPKRNSWWIYGITAILLLGFPLIFGFKTQKNKK